MKNGLFITIILAIWGVLKMVGKLLKAILEVLTGIVIFFGLYIPLFYLLFGIILLATTDFAFGGGGTDQLLYFIGLGVCVLLSVIITIRHLFKGTLSRIFDPFRKYRDEMRHGREGDRRDDDLRSHRDDYEEDSRPDEGDRRYEDRRYDDEYSDRGYGYRPYAGRPPMRRYEEGRYEDDRPYYYERREQPRYYEEEEPYPERREPSRHSEESRDRDLYGSDRRSSYDYEEEQYDRAPRRPYAYENADNARDEREHYGVSPDRFVPRPAPERPLIYYSKRRPGVLVKEYSDRFELYEEDAAGRRFLGTEYKDD